MKLTIYCESENTLYIREDGITPPEAMASWSKWIEYQAFTYEERIEKSPYKEEIGKALEEHKGCNIRTYNPDTMIWC